MLGRIKQLSYLMAAFSAAQVSRNSRLTPALRQCIEPKASSVLCRPAHTAVHISGSGFPCIQGPSRSAAIAQAEATSEDAVLTTAMPNWAGNILGI